MKMTITNAELLNLFSALTNLNLTGNAKFSYAVAKNRALLKPQAEALQEAANSYAKNNPRVKEYQEKGDSLIKKFAVDPAGKPVVRNAGDGASLQRVIPPENMQNFTIARQELDEEYKDTLLGIQLHQADFLSVLKEECEVDLRLLKLSDIPSDGINTQVMNLIFIFVEDEDRTNEPAAS